MRKTLSTIAAVLLLTIGGIAAEQAVAAAPPKPPPKVVQGHKHMFRAADVFAGSCGWPTNSPQWYWSDYYHIFFWGDITHRMINGRNYRKYLVYYPVWGIYDTWLVYCG